MRPNLRRILNEAKEYKRKFKTPLSGMLEHYKRKIFRAIATDREKKIAALELVHILEVKP